MFGHYKRLVTPPLSALHLSAPRISGRRWMRGRELAPMMMSDAAAEAKPRESTASLVAPLALSLISRLTGKLRTWRKRAQERAELAGMSQGELHDIGVLSADRWEETHKPFWRE
jgi:uncharacterized protein YjiS (DUF1127 family)